MLNEFDLQVAHDMMHERAQYNYEETKYWDNRKELFADDDTQKLFCAFQAARYSGMAAAYDNCAALLELL